MIIHGTKKPFALYLLLGLLALQSMAALYGGFRLMLDPSGFQLGFPFSWLENTPFSDYLIPGLILFFLLGVLPGLLFFALLFPGNFKWAKWTNFINVFKQQYWAWAYSLYLGIMIIIWMDVQIMLIGYSMILQSVYSFVGIAIVICSLLPSVRDYYKLSDSTILYQSILTKHKAVIKYKDLV